MPDAQKIAGLLAERGALETISRYLNLLAQAFVLAPLYKYSPSEVRRRRSPPKLVMLSNGLLAGAGAAESPSPDREPERWRRWVENACLAHAVNTGRQVAYWRQQPWEVDGVIVEGKGGYRGRLPCGRADELSARRLGMRRGPPQPTSTESTTSSLKTLAA